MYNVSQGHVEKLGLLYERNKQAVFRFFYRLTGSYDTSQDLFQEVFIRILKYRTKYKKGLPFLPWMYTIARNVSADYFRKNSRYDFARRLDDTHVAVADDVPADAELLSDEADKLLHRAMNMLTVGGQDCVDGTPENRYSYRN